MNGRSMATRYLILLVLGVVLPYSQFVSAGLPLVLYMRREAAGPGPEHGLDH